MLKIRRPGRKTSGLRTVRILKVCRTSGPDVMSEPWTLYCVSQLGLASAYILKQSAMFQTSLLSAKKRRLVLAYRHCERDKKNLSLEM